MVIAQRGDGAWLEEGVYHPDLQVPSRAHRNILMFVYLPIFYGFVSDHWPAPVSTDKPPV